MVLVLVGLEDNFYGYALHYLHVIARSIFRRQQTESCTGGAGNALHMTVVFARKGIHGNRGALSGMHVCELRLLEIRRDPDIVERNNGEQCLARLDVLSDLHVFVHDSADRRHNRAVLQIKLRLSEFRAFLRGRGLRRLCASPHGIHLLRSRM